MLYLNTKHIEEMGVNWNETIHVIKDAVQNYHLGHYSQPIKPYLRFKDLTNRIIAMPAYIGGDFESVGIKWIASYPKNIEQGIQRAHSVNLLNDPDTGKPLATLNTAIVSGIRTASVSGLIIQECEKARHLEEIKLGIIGFGPIGQLHLQMAYSLLGNKISTVYLYDIKGVNQEHIPEDIREKTQIVDSYEQAYEDADIFITCTVSRERYIDKKPKDGAILLNISLRDFTPAILDYNPIMIVDNWEEVCRENTDIEVMHRENNLQQEDSLSIVDVVCNRSLQEQPSERTIFFNPMGMAIFDVAISSYYYRLAQKNGIGVQLED